MTTGASPYVVPVATDLDPAPGILATTIVARHAMVDIGGVTAHAETFNGAIPGPVLRLDVGDRAFVRLVNEMHHPIGIHWHGIELANGADGTEVTQDGVRPAAHHPPPAPAPAGGTHLYAFTANRPGLYWYHPHHHHATNHVFRGMYGMIVVNDPHEAALIAADVLPGAADTRQLVLSDITVCKAPGSNDTATYPDPTTMSVADRAEWLSGASAQPPPTPLTLCQVPTAAADDGSPALASYTAGDVPSVFRTGQHNEGQTVLTNGVNVGGRLGRPDAPGALLPGAQKMDVLAGQGLRLQIANCSINRYFRLILTTAVGVTVPLVRVGGEGGLLDKAVVEGGATTGGFDTKFGAGEILLPPGSRADVVAAIPPAATGGLTLWTRDYRRSGGLWAGLPTVPVMHLNVTGPAAATFTIGGGTALRAAIPAPVETLGAATGTLLDPAAFAPAKPGSANQDIQVTGSAGIDGVSGSFMGFVPFTAAPHIATSRWAEQDRILELTVTNLSGSHHPFHLHGFSIQPIALEQPGFPSFAWPYREFRDNVDIPAAYTLRFRVRLADRPLPDGVTLGGALGRWLFHCHIFIHHHQGMISELVVSDTDGSERPYVTVAGSWAYTPVGGIAQRQGTYHHPDGDPVSLTASTGVVTDDGGGTWSWTYDATGVPAHTEYVYLTATDQAGRADQTVFRLKIGAPDDGSDNGDPHVHTVDGKGSDFQGAGEFVLLRDHEGMEVQARHWPVAAAAPVTDPATGLTSCVSLNTAVAARVGEHRIAYQQGWQGRHGELVFFVDGDKARLPREGLDLGDHRVTAMELGNGAAGLRVDYASQAVLTVTPHYWTAYGIWYLNVRVSRTQADEGIMGAIPADGWLPLLPARVSSGPMPATLSERHNVLHRTFADAWRVTDETSLFVYEPGTSTKSFTDPGWPAPQAPCVVPPQFEVPGAHPPAAGLPEQAAEWACRRVTDDALHGDCVFDVASTGDATFARAYLLEQQMFQQATAVQVTVGRPDGPAVPVTATVLPLVQTNESRAPAGSVAFMVDGRPAGSPVTLDPNGRATIVLDGSHRVRAEYGGGGPYRPSVSATFTVAGRGHHH
ncbi:multicopper oxidase domain-containing protein [Actinoplanes aureus]|uniref:Multicopper oxidase domain-containing protein n=1 Tax=Actinoplanes aureus TaxID=2792083 RepID=A0A931CEH9_9ACTN|nr:multicopper oxidase domain-containing protein [Actinoplanes aureus]MBG0568415.1 multicopper oxidase domain-containing protein [Actinoplanes aureus]